MLKVTPECQSRWDEVLEFARCHHLWDQLWDTLEYLETYAQGPGCLYDAAQGGQTCCLLFPEFAPLSFSFQMQRRAPAEADFRDWFHGAVIFHGPHDGFGGGGAPTFSVQLEDMKTAGWRVHT